MDYTGTGNTLNMRHPHVLQLIMDSLRYWVHRDARRRLPLRPRARRSRASCTTSTGSAAFFDIIQQDPVRQPGQADRRAVGRRRGRLSGRQLPAAVVGVERQVPRHACATSGAATSGTLGRVRLRASPAARDLYEATGRRPYASINFITAHDGFTLRDLVSLQREAQRGERRGQPRRRERQPIVELRRRGADRRRRRSSRCARGSSATSWRRCCSRRACRCCCGGDEIGRTQQGNNNAYCQDNEISWFDWEHADEDLLAVHRAA